MEFIGPIGSEFSKHFFPIIDACQSYYLPSDDLNLPSAGHRMIIYSQHLSLQLLSHVALLFCSKILKRPCLCVILYFVYLFNFLKGSPLILQSTGFTATHQLLNQRVIEAHFSKQGHCFSPVEAIVLLYKLREPLLTVLCMKNIMEKVSSVLMLTILLLMEIISGIICLEMKIYWERYMTDTQAIHSPENLAVYASWTSLFPLAFELGQFCGVLDSNGVGSNCCGMVFYPSQI